MRKMSTSFFLFVLACFALAKAFPLKAVMVRYFVANVGASESGTSPLDYFFLRARYFAHKAGQSGFTYKGGHYTTLTGNKLPL